MSAVLSEHLPLLANAPDGIQKLRGLILELAVRGKLVPQDPADEPASELLKRIAAERARLETEGMVKKAKTLPLVGKDEQAFAVPMGWEWSRLSTISLVNPRNSLDDSVLVSFVPMAMIGTRFEGRHGQEFRKWSEVKQGFTHFAEGDIAVAKITPCFENSKACVFSGLMNGAGAGTTELHVVRPIANSLAPRYILAYLKSPMFLSVGEAKMTGTAGQKRLPKEVVEGNPFPLPPLAEQNRIVAKVDELMDLCDRLETEQADAETAHTKLVDTLLGTLAWSADATELAANWQRLAEHFDTLFTTEASLDTLKQTVLRLAVMGKLVQQDPNDEPASELLKRIAKERAQLEAKGTCKKSKPLPSVEESDQSYQIPPNWKYVRLQELCSTITDGTHQTPTYTESGRPFLSAQNVKPFRFIPEIFRYVSEEDYQGYVRTTKPEFGDVLLTRVGAMIGEAAVIDKEMDFAIYVSLALLKPLRPNVLAEYITLWLNSPFGTQTSIRDTLGRGVSAGNLNLGLIRAFVLPLPPAKEQHRIVAKVDELMVLCDRLKASLAESRTRQARLAATLIESALQAA